MTELWQLGALELADRIRNLEVSSRGVVEEHVGIFTPIDPIAA